MALGAFGYDFFGCGVVVYVDGLLFVEYVRDHAVVVEWDPLVWCDAFGWLGVGGCDYCCGVVGFVVVDRCFDFVVEHVYCFLSYFGEQLRWWCFFCDERRHALERCLVICEPC